MRNICTINKKTKTNPQYLVQCLRFDGFYYNSQLSTICAMLKQSAKPRSYASITWSSRDFYVTPNRAGSTCSLNKQWPRGKVKHCPISKNLISSFTARCDLPAESWARKNLKKGRTLMITSVCVRTADSDVIAILVAFMAEFKAVCQNLELWVNFGTGGNKRWIFIHMKTWETLSANHFFFSLIHWVW